MFGGITDEQLDLMTLEQVRLWTLTRQQAPGSPVEDNPSSERANRMREASNNWGLTWEGMNNLVSPESGSNRAVVLKNQSDKFPH